MACRTLLRRKAQLNLLEQACRHGLVVRISLRDRQTVCTTARMVALEPEGILLERGADHKSDAEIMGQPLDVYFECDDECYVFRTVADGRGPQPQNGRNPSDYIKLHLPLRIERSRRRRTLRLDLADGPLIEGQFTHVLDGRRQFKARLINLNDGGVGVTALASEVAEIYTGDLFWIELQLPDASESSEFVARLVHLRPIKNTNEITMGWAFQPDDDGSSYEDYVQRLESLLMKNKRSSDR